MREPTSFSNHFGSALILFALAAVMALLLLVSAFVVWLSQLMGSLMGAMLLLGGFFLLVAALLYRFSLRESFRRVSDRLDTIYDVARTVQWGYERVSELLNRWLR